MFKKAIAVLGAVIMSAVSMAASAQTITTSFKTSGGDAVTLDGVRSFECVTGGFKLEHQAEGFQLTYADTSGVCAKMQTSAYAATYFVQVPGTSRYLNSLEARRVYNDSGNSKIIWKAGPESVYPGTAVLTAFQGRAQ
jgi:hypothetical protein